MIVSFGFIGFTFDVVGKILVAITALGVHHRVWQEHKIDKVVFKEMYRERVLGLVGVGLIVLGYLMQIPGKLT